MHLFVVSSRIVFLVNYAMNLQKLKLWLHSQTFDLRQVDMHLKLSAWTTLVLLLLNMEERMRNVGVAFLLVCTFGGSLLL